jgi:hypothetical protein
MNENQRNAWSNIGFSLIAVCLFGILAFMTLVALPITNIKDPPDRGKVAQIPMVQTDPITYTLFLPIVLKNWCQSGRPPLQGTANFAGEVEIQTPGNCTTDLPTETAIIASGTFTGTADNMTLWVLVYAPNTLYYPQSPNACAGEPPFQSDEDWQVPVYLGLEGGEPEWFDIIVVLVDEQASQFFSNLVIQGCQTGQYIGAIAPVLNRLAITEKAFITVQTSD